MKKSEYISKLMAKVAKEELYDYDKSLFEQNLYNKNKGRVKGMGHHKIVFGAKSLEDEIKSNKSAYLWTTGEEIVNMGYCGGELTIQNVVIHTICHEYAHLMDFFENGSRKGQRHHNKFFYLELDKIYQGGAYDRVKSALYKDNIFKSLSFEKEERIYKKTDFKKGDMISWRRNKEKSSIKTGYEVLRRNKSSLTVRDTNSFSGKMLIHYACVVGKG